MSDQMKISGPVHVQSDSAERVAFDLMEKIDYYGGNEASRKTEKYWLDLYRHCRKVVLHGSSAEDAMKA